MEEIKFFYDIFLPEDICGIFTPGHFLMMAYFIVLSTVIIFALRNKSHNTLRKLMLGVAVVVTSVEVIKITLRIIKHQWYDSWIPLYFCSLFIFAIWFSLSKNEFLKNIGCSFITMGGIFASIVFSIYPTTSLAIYPLWHPESIHSYNYHIVMFATGVLMLLTGYYRPKKEHGLNYFVFLTMGAIPSVILNITLGTNCLFLRDAFGLPILQGIIDYSPVLYGVLAFFAQAVALYWFNFGVYSLALKAKKGV